MLILLLGGYDVANAVQERLLLQQALRAGGQFAISFPPQAGDTSAQNLSGVLAAINQALPRSWQTEAPPTITFPTCGGICIKLQATRAYSSFLPNLVTQNSASYVVRVQ